MPENWSWRTRQLLTCRCVSVMLLRSMQIHEGVSLMLKLKWCSAWWCCRRSSSVAHQSSRQSVREATTPPAWIMQPPWLQTPLNGLFHLRERLITMQNNWKEPRSILMSRQIDVQSMGNHAIIVSNTHALPAEYKCQSNKTEQSIYECLLVSVLTFRAATNFGCIDSFFCPIPETKKWWVTVSRCYRCRFVLNSKRLLSTSCNKQGQRSE